MFPGTGFFSRRSASESRAEERTHHWKQGDQNIKEKSCPMSMKKLPKNLPRVISLGEAKIFDPFSENAKMIGQFGQTIVDTGFKKLPKRQKNRPICSHWRIDRDIDIGTRID